MKQITVRGVGAELHNRIMAEAKRRRLSMNTYILLVLREAAGLDDGLRDRELVFDDLDHLAGTWTEDDYEAFIEHLQVQRKIDTEMWP